MSSFMGRDSNLPSRGWWWVRSAGQTLSLIASGSSFSSLSISTSETPGRVILASIGCPFSKMWSSARLPSLLNRVKVSVGPTSSARSSACASGLLGGLGRLQSSLAL